MPSLPGSLSIWAHGVHSGALDALCRAAAMTLQHLVGTDPTALLPEGVETHDYDVLDGADQSACGSDANLFTGHQPSKY